MSTTQPDHRRTIDDLLGKARTHDRYDNYDIAAAETRLRQRQATRQRSATAPSVPAWTPVWTEPGADRAPDADNAWWDLNAVSLLILFGPDVDRHVSDFITAQYADKTGALVFACLLHLADDTEGARFWWRFAAGAGHPIAEYCLFLEHAQTGEYHDADHWGRQLIRHHFEPTYLCGDRATAPLLNPPLIDQLRNHITQSNHPDLGNVPLPQPPLVQELRHLTTL
ncbi:hypothetical protein GCM10009837_48640 [Streptomyces durmitorensis]|uniref:Uncharacterized protein n=1 Tax=Streptomyces durmitorensis TaxID=319947 RepID=A0ABY4Q376_9ACTN|nr:hypothetical protein [Streptomyces durmitorensis]UQT60176.1 hypothetical protein M4V62_36805 [Streptomyces durmitorensis]